MKVALLLSGGVDSSVALALLKEQGHEVTASYLKIWLEDELAYLGECPWEEDLNFAEKVCQQLNVPLQVISLQREYWQRVVKYTLDEVRAGRTPNPDIMCNRRVKFGAFWDKLESLGQDFEAIASGHYAQKVVAEDGSARLMRSPDVVKDQTYFLSQITPEQLKKALFPIGHLPKAKVRALAERFDLPNQQRKDSQGICFLGKIKYSDFIKHHLDVMPGEILEQETGQELGQHDGYWFYTLGQRHGLGLSGGPWYVVRKDVATNVVYVSKQYQELAKPRDTFTTEPVNWLTRPPQGEEWKQLSVKLRHGEQQYGCEVEVLTDGLAVKIDGQDQGIAPGQFAVFYHGDWCLGGAVMRSSGSTSKRGRINEF